MLVFPLCGQRLLMGLISSVFLFPSLAMAAASWWDSRWESRIEITSNTDLVAASLTDFPALVDLDGQVPQSVIDDPANLRFVTADGQELAHEVDDSVTNDSRFWVRLPSLADTTSTTIYAYYDFTGADAPRQFAPEQVWSNDYRTVHHLSEDKRNPRFEDSTDSQVQGRTPGTGRTRPEYRSDGVLGGHRYLSGELQGGNQARSGRIEFDDPALDISGAFSAGSWANLGSQKSEEDHHPILWKGNVIRGQGIFGSDSDYVFRIAVRSDNELTWGVECTSGLFGAAEEAYFDGGQVASGWAHYALSFDGTTLRGFVNGEQVASSTACQNDSIATSDTPMISGFAETGSSLFGDQPPTTLRGSVDDIRLSATSRSSEWFTTHHNNVSSHDSFWTFGDPESRRVIVDRFRIQHPQTALTCDAAEIVVEPCYDAQCSDTGQPFSASVTPGSNEVSFDGSGAAVSVQAVSRQPGIETISLTAESGVDVVNPPECTTLSGESSDCEIDFQDSGFRLSVDDDYVADSDGELVVEAVESSPDGRRCVPLFGDRQERVRFSGSYVEPQTLNATPPVSLGGSQLALDGSTTERDLVFQDGVARVDLRYPEAGLQSLTAFFEGEQGSETEGLVLQGQTSFTSRPARICPQFEAGSCDDASVSCDATAVSGEQVTLNWKAIGSGGSCDALNQSDPLVNFQSPDFTTDHQRQFPAQGRDGDVTPESGRFEAGDEGNLSHNARFAEVGIFSVTADPVSYYETSVPFGQTLSPRFIPAYFDVSTDEQGVLSPSCDASNSFIYMGAPRSWSLVPTLEVTARNSQDVRTRNYQGQAFGLSEAGADVDYPVQDRSETNAAGDPVQVTYTDNGLSVSPSDPGRASIALNVDDAIKFEKTPQNQIEPFPADIRIALSSLSDFDGVSMASEGVAFDTALADLDVVYGRATIEPVYGPETVELPVSFSVQRFNGQTFQANGWDSCTAYAPEQFSLDPSIGSLLGNSGQMDAGEPQTDRALVITPAEAGQSTITWTGIDEWLKPFDADGNVVPVSAPVTLGVYRGHDRIIYWREVSE